MEGNQGWQLVLEIVEEAQDAPPEKRGAIIKTRCGGDKDLEKRVWAALKEDLVEDNEAELLEENEKILQDNISTFKLPFWESRTMDGDLADKIPAEYKVLEKLSEGGQGEVYRVYQKKLKHHYALKIFKHKGVISGEEKARARFSREAQILARLKHPNICDVIDVGETDDGTPYIKMELLDGKSLQSVVAHGPRLLDEVLDIFVQAVDGLVVAHDHDLIHQDIKPANIMLCTDGVVKLIDFGVSRDIIRSKPDPMGTMRYMSPEQLREEPDLDFRTDIWSIGFTMLEMLWGKYPLGAGASIEHIQSDEPIEVPLFAGYLKPVLKKCLHKDKKLRYRSAVALKADLQSIVDRRERAANRKRVLKTAASWVLPMLILIAGLLYVLVGSSWGGPKPALAVVIDPGFTIDENQPRLDLWLNREFNQFIPELLDPIDFPVQFLPDASESQISAMEGRDVYRINVGVDQEDEQLFLILDVRDAAGVMYGKQERVLLSKDYVQDLGVLREGIYQVLAQNTTEPLDFEGIERPVMDLEDMPNADSLIRKNLDPLGPGVLPARLNVRDPDSLLIRQGFYHYGLGNYQAAIRIFSAIIGQDSLYTPAYLPLANAYWSQGDTARTDESFRQADAVRSSDYAVLDWWSMHALRVEDFLLADSLITTMTTLWPDSGAIYNRAGVYALETQDTITATLQFQKAIDLGNYALGHANLGYLYYATGRYPDAALQYENALRLDSTDYLSWGDLAFALSHIPDREGDAQFHFRSAVQLAQPLFDQNPNQPEVVMDLAQYHMQLSDTTQARTYLTIFDAFDSRGMEDYSYLMQARDEVYNWLNSP